MRRNLPALLLPCLLLSSFAANSQAAKPAAPARPVCFTLTEASRLRDSLRHLPTVRREAQEWRLGYVNARIAADTNAYAAQQWHHALLRSQVAFSGQQLLLNDVRQEKDKFKHRAHRKGVLITVLLAVIGGLVYLR